MTTHSKNIIIRKHFIFYICFVLAMNKNSAKRARYNLENTAVTVNLCCQRKKISSQYQ